MAGAPGRAAAKGLRCTRDRHRTGLVLGRIGRRSGDQIDWRFPGGQTFRGQILAEDRPRVFSIRYYGGSRATFTLCGDDEGGTEVHLADDGVSDTDRADVLAGWVSVLLALKAHVDHGVDLRNHHPARTWDKAYCDN